MYIVYLCQPSEASTWYCVIPGGHPPQDWQNLQCAGEELDSNPGLLICSQVRYHWATSPPGKSVYIQCVNLLYLHMWCNICSYLRGFFRSRNSRFTKVHLYTIFTYVLLCYLCLVLTICLLGLRQNKFWWHCPFKCRLMLKEIHSSAHKKSNYI